MTIKYLALTSFKVKQQGQTIEIKAGQIITTPFDKVKTLMAKGLLKSYHELDIADELVLEGQITRQDPETTPKPPELDIVPLSQMPLKMFTPEEVGLDIPGLVYRLAALSDEETDLFNEHFEKNRNAGIGREMAAFMAYCELKEGQC